MPYLRCTCLDREQRSEKVTCGGIEFIELTCPLERKAIAAAHKKKYDTYKFFAAALKPIEIESIRTPQPSFLAN